MSKTCFNFYWKWKKLQQYRFISLEPSRIITEVAQCFTLYWNNSGNTEKMDEPQQLYDLITNYYYYKLLLLTLFLQGWRAVYGLLAVVCSCLAWMVSWRCTTTTTMTPTHADSRPAAGGWCEPQWQLSAEDGGLHCPSELRCISKPHTPSLFVSRWRLLCLGGPVHLPGKVGVGVEMDTEETRSVVEGNWSQRRPSFYFLTSPWES